jgi:hypothetical protein
MGTREDPSIMFRLPADERDRIAACIEESRLPPHVWYRMMLLAACGETEMVTALKRAQRAGERERDR